MSDSPLKNHIPINLAKSEGHLLCGWLDTFDIPFVEPFFDETLLKCRSWQNQVRRPQMVSVPAMICEWADTVDKVDPVAFVFHISRCGSTLVSQLLATVKENIVISEAPFFDTVLRLPFKEPDFREADIDNLFIAAIKHYGQKRTGQEKRLFIKTDSWHLFFYKQLRRLYPQVPFVFIYRIPDEVFRSHRKQPGMQAVPGLIEPEVFGIKPDELVYDLDIYLAKVLECYFSHYLEIFKTDHQSLFLNYNEGPMAMIKKIAAFTNTPIDPQDLSNMEERSRYHSKRPGDVFTEKQASDVPDCLNKAMALYLKLEEVVGYSSIEKNQLLNDSMTQ